MSNNLPLAAVAVLYSPPHPAAACCGNTLGVWQSAIHMLKKRCAIDVAFQARSKNAEQSSAQLRVAHRGACFKASTSL